MEHPCEKCGVAVEEGRPFCPKCRAPQVRVELPAAPPAADSAPRTDLGIGADALSPAGLRSSAGPSSLFRIALQAGLLGVMANVIPFGLGMVLTGILAALLYHRASGGMLVTGKAARLGAMAGAVAFAATALLTVSLVVLLQAQQQFHDIMMKAVEQGVANPSDPEVQAFLQWLHTPQGFGIILAFGMIGALALSMLFSAVGGVIGATLFRDRGRTPF